MLPPVVLMPPPVFEPGVLPGGLTVGDVVAFGSIWALLGPAPPLGCIGWFWLLLVWANATPLARASAAPQSAKPLIDIWLFSLCRCPLRMNGHTLVTMKRSGRDYRSGGSLLFVGIRDRVKNRLSPRRCIRAGFRLRAPFRRFASSPHRQSTRCRRAGQLPRQADDEDADASWSP